MTTPSLLSRSISSALAAQLARARPAPTAADLAADAQDALDCIEAVMHSISAICQPPSSERYFIALQLLRASCDHGRALTYLLANNPLDMAGSALALHRSQIEQFLRAVFFAHIATEEELQDFIENDKGPRRRNHKNNWENIYVAALAEEVQARLNEVEGEVAPEDGKLARMVANAWSALCGFVHGGRAIHALYLDQRNEIGCAVPPEVHVETTVNTVALVNFSLTVACTIAGMPTNEENEALEPPLKAFHAYVESRNNRLVRLGMTDLVKRLG